MSNEIIFNNPATSGYILIKDKVMVKLGEYRQKFLDSNEAGGLLLGFRRGPHLEIIDLTEPYPNDVRHRTSFYRCDPLHEIYAQKMWSKSKRTIDYLGEWHTHPEQNPSPSGLDVNEWKKLMVARKFSMVFLILGNKGNWIGVGEGEKLSRCKNAA